MVKALLEGRKTMTRRVVKPQPEFYHGGKKVRVEGDCWYPNEKKGLHYANQRHFRKGMPMDFCPYGQVGNRLWVREIWNFTPMLSRTAIVRYQDLTCRGVEIPEGFNHKVYLMRGYWRPSIYMPRWASRITLEITNIRCERLQDITETDAQAEEVPCTELYHDVSGDLHRAQFADLWDSINQKRGFGWERNTWVWVIEFKRIE